MKKSYYFLIAKVARRWGLTPSQRMLNALDGLSSALATPDALREAPYLAMMDEADKMIRKKTQDAIFESSKK